MRRRAPKPRRARRPGRKRSALHGYESALCVHLARCFSAPGERQPTAEDVERFIAAKRPEGRVQQACLTTQACCTHLRRAVKPGWATGGRSFDVAGRRRGRLVGVQWAPAHRPVPHYATCPWPHRPHLACRSSSRRFDSRAARGATCAVGPRISGACCSRRCFGVGPATASVLTDRELRRQVVAARRPRTARCSLGGR